MSRVVRGSAPGKGPEMNNVCQQYAGLIDEALDGQERDTVANDMDGAHQWLQLAGEIAAGGKAQGCQFAFSASDLPPPSRREGPPSLSGGPSSCTIGRRWSAGPAAAFGVAAAPGVVRRLAAITRVNGDGFGHRARTTSSVLARVGFGLLVRDRPGLEELARGAVVAEVVDGHAGRVDGEGVERLGPR